MLLFLCHGDDEPTPHPAPPQRRSRARASHGARAATLPAAPRPEPLPGVQGAPLLAGAAGGAPAGGGVLDTTEELLLDALSSQREAQDLDLLLLGTAGGKRKRSTLERFLGGDEELFPSEQHWLVRGLEEDAEESIEDAAVLLLVAELARGGPEVVCIPGIMRQRLPPGSCAHTAAEFESLYNWSDVALHSQSDFMQLAYHLEFADTIDPQDRGVKFVHADRHVYYGVHMLLTYLLRLR